MRVSHLNAIFWLVWLGLVAFSYFNSYDDPSSIFYRASRAYVQRFSALRAAEADAFVDSLTNASSTNPPPTPAGNGSLLCIGIPSVNRTMQSFLKHTLASLVDRLDPEQRRAVHLVVLLADKQPRQHTAFGAKWLELLADEVLVYGSTNDTSSIYHPVSFKVTGGPRGDGRVENMRMDHSLLVERCRQHGSSYFALVEDDIIAARDWFVRFRKALAVVEREREQAGKDWIYLRLFYSEIFMGWNNEEWLTYSETIFLVYVVVLLGFLELRRRFKIGPIGSGAKAHGSNFIAALLFGLWMPAMIVLYFMAGRVSVSRLIPWPSRGVREMPQYGCCAQGLVFPQRHLEGFQKLLRDPPYDFAGDQILEGWAERQGLVKWALDPTAFQHVGLKESSSGLGRAEVWNFSFERQHARR